MNKSLTIRVLSGNYGSVITGNYTGGNYG